MSNVRDVVRESCDDLFLILYRGTIYKLSVYLIWRVTKIIYLNKSKLLMEKKYSHDNDVSMIDIDEFNL